MRIATWNINSVRLRIAHVLRFIKEYDIDIMCLQETKTENKYFPIDKFINIGYFVLRKELFKYLNKYNNYADFLTFCGNPFSGVLHIDLICSSVLPSLSLATFIISFPVPQSL